MNEIRNIYCVGRNYADHAAELGNALPERPLVFTKPTHALFAIDGKEVRLPADAGIVHYEVELVLRAARSYEPGITVDELVSEFALGLDFTLRDVQSEQVSKGRPWLPAKGFLGSAGLTRFVPFPGAAALAGKSFELRKNGAVVQTGHVSRMIFSLQTIIDFIGQNYGLGENDVIYTGTPEGVGPTLHGDLLELLWEGESLGAVTAKLDRKTTGGSGNHGITPGQ